MFYSTAANTLPEATGNDASRLLEAICLVFLGAFFSLIYSVLGLILVTAFLDAHFCPPLQPQENFGQFGMLIFVVGPGMLLLAISWGFIPYCNVSAWLVFALVTLVVVSPLGIVFSSEFTVTSTYFVAYLIGCAAMQIVGLFFVVLFRWLKRFGIGD